MTYEDVKRIRINPTAKAVDNKELSKMIDIAVDRQIPKKPIPDDAIDGMFCCPGCECWFNGYFQPHHCRCGQALDWSDEK